MRIVLALVLTAACTSAPPAATTETPTATVAATTARPTPTAAATAAPSTTSPTAAAPAPTFTPPGQLAGCPPQQGGDATVNRAPVTMRAAGQAGYDRVVIDFGPGGIPPFTVDRVDRIRGLGSGLPIEMQGSVFIRLHFRMAGGMAEYPGPTRILPDGVVVRDVLFLEFEGATTVGIGLTRLICPTVSIQSGGRLVLDFDY